MQCMHGSCRDQAQWIGVTPSTAANGETHPTFACDDHVDGLVAVRTIDGDHTAGDNRVLAQLDPDGGVP